ncbi:hypothetical protein [Paenibacillus crassostreae]|nr:hypothetical protein [Paenibacillus crassostreae]
MTHLSANQLGTIKSYISTVTLRHLISVKAAPQKWVRQSTN